jgi:hypothetical protein
MLAITCSHPGAVTAGVLMLILLDRVSTWIERLGDLGIRKNVSSDEWRTIYLHCVRWLEDPTRKKGDFKLKRTKQDIEIFVRGRTYSWNQAWKNMKSAGAIGQLPQPEGMYKCLLSLLPSPCDLAPGSESLGPLPSEIEIRTLSSVSLPGLSTPARGVTQPSSPAINTPAHDPLTRGRIPTSQQTSSRSSDNPLSPLSVSCNFLDNSAIEWTEDCPKNVWTFCTSLLPIGRLITETIGMY